MALNPIITLWEAQNIGLIILFPSGVRYHTQAGGYACQQPTAEGVYVPLHDSGIDQEAMLNTHFYLGKYRGWCSDGIDHEDADVVDYIMSLARHTTYIKVDRARLGDSCEAWIYVDVTTWPDGNKVHMNSKVPRYPMSGFAKCKGVLTWANSD